MNKWGWNKEVKVDWSNGTDFWREIVEVVACTNRVLKMKEHLPFCNEFNILFIEERVFVDLVVQLSTRAALKDLAFWWEVCFTHNMGVSPIWSAYSLPWLGGSVYPILVVVCSQMGKGQWENRETDEEHDEDCAEEIFQLWGNIVSIFQVDKFWN